ncbi:DHA2 family efflux MFS transporter permease subunit [Actinomadura sp. 6N118]|uniref:DHA2 family efflux MFS transporter permease subunit n=1 Tax=Actinomadura sp. 6N118 TaxID=3375151 RepID=UPI00378F1DC0
MGRTSRVERLDPAVLKLAGILVLGAMAPLLDGTIVNVALHTLGRELKAPVSTVQWVTTGYLLAVAMAIPITGWAAERFGAKRIWLFSLVIFLAGSMLCGVAWNVGSLIVFRVVQGTGGGLMLPVLQTLLLRASGGRNIGRLMAVVTLPALLGPILGPVIGGLIVGHLSWRWIFFVNVPLCVLAILLAYRGLPADSPQDGDRLDWAGLLLLSPGLAALIYGLAEVGDQGAFDHAEVVVPLMAGTLLLAGFVLHALRIAHPLIELRLLGERSFAASSALLFLSGLALYGSMLLLPLYYQQLRGQSVIAAGLLMAPQGLGSLLARGAGGLADRIGPRPVILAGVTLTALGTVPFALAGRHAGGLVLAAALVARGAGLSAVNMAVMVGAFNRLAPEQIPHASSMTRIMQQVGGSFGAAVLAVVLQRQLTDHPGVAGQATAFGHTFAWSVAFTLLAVVPALLLPKVRCRRGEQTKPTTQTTNP